MIKSEKTPLVLSVPEICMKFEFEMYLMVSHNLSEGVTDWWTVEIARFALRI